MSIDKTLHTLKEEYSNFGNHTRRYRSEVEKSMQFLEKRLKKENLRFEEYFYNLWPEAEYQLMLLEQLGRGTEEKLKLIKLFFAFHYLKMNTQNISFMTDSLAEKLDTPFEIYRRVLLSVRQTFFTLSRALTNRLSYYSGFYPEFPRYVFFNVGSLIDHEDLDVGIVYDADQPSEEFNQYISRLSQKFFKTVTHMHYYLAESLDTNHYGGNIDSYLSYLNSNKEDFVFTSQILGATRLMGDMELFYEFKARLVERYFRGTSTYRINYIDLATKEIESVCRKPLSRDIIRPKAECYRIFTSLSSALRIAYQIHRGNIWETFDQFLRVDYKNRIFYELLKDSYAFVQILRYLFNLYVSQKDSIDFNDPIEGEWLDLIARKMGIADRTALHKDYNYIADKGRESALYLASDLRKKFLS